MLVATKEISLCPETPFDQCNLPQDTRAYYLFRLIVNEREMTKLPSADCTPIPIQSIRITPSPLQHSPGACSRDRAYRRPPLACSGDWRAGPLRPSVHTRPGPASAARRAGLLRPAVRAGVLSAARARRRRPAQGIRGAWRALAARDFMSLVKLYVHELDHLVILQFQFIICARMILKRLV